MLLTNTRKQFLIIYNACTIWYYVYIIYTHGEIIAFLFDPPWTLQTFPTALIFLFQSKFGSFQHRKREKPTARTWIPRMFSCKTINRIVLVWNARGGGSSVFPIQKIRAQFNNHQPWLERNLVLTCKDYWVGEIKWLYRWRWFIKMGNAICTRMCSRWIKLVLFFRAFQSGVKGDGLFFCKKARERWNTCNQRFVQLKHQAGQKRQKQCFQGLIYESSTQKSLNLARAWKWCYQKWLGFNPHVCQGKLAIVRVSLLPPQLSSTQLTIEDQLFGPSAGS